MAATTLARPRPARRIPWATLLIYLVLIFGAFFMLMPFVYMLSTSLKPANQVFLFPPRWIPNPIVWANYPAAFDMLGPYLAHVHVKNVAWRPSGQAPDGATTWAENWAALREGQADIAAYFRALHTHGYDGWVTCEDFSTAVPLAERTRDNLAYLKSVWQRTTTG